MKRALLGVWAWLLSYGWMVALALGALALGGAAQAVLDLRDQIDRNSETIEFVCDSVNENNADQVRLLQRIRAVIPDDQVQRFIDGFIDDELDPIPCPSEG